MNKLKLKLVKYIRKIKFVSLILYGIVFTIGMIVGHLLKNESQSNVKKTTYNKNKFDFGLTPSEHQIDQKSGSKALEKHIEAYLKKPCRVFVANDFTGIIEAMRAGKVQGALLGQGAYLYAKERANAELILLAIRNGQSYFRGAFYVKSSSSIKKLSDLKGKSIAFVDPLSTSGYIFPMALLIKKGLIRDKDDVSFFSRMIFAGSHESTILALSNGSVDACTAFEGAPRIILPKRSQEFRILDTTEQIPNMGIAVSRDLSYADVLEIKRSFLDLTPEKNDKLLIQLGNIEGFIVADDKDAELVRNAHKKLDLSY